MKKYIKILIIITLVIGLQGCDGYLDVDPVSTVNPNNFYKDKTEAEIAIAGIYSVYASTSLYGRDLSIIYDSGTDEGYFNKSFSETWTVGLYRHTPADRFVLSYWAELYEIINLSNLFTEQLKTENFPDQDQYNSLLAEARFLRAHAYSLLTSMYEEVPLRTASTKSQEDYNKPVASLEKLYEQIISDFTFASEHLPSFGSAGYTPGRASKMAAHGLLARTYLKMAGFPLRDTDKYQKAKEQCKIIIDSNIHGLNASVSETRTDSSGDPFIYVTEDGYRKHFLSYIQSNYDARESIFEISFRNLRDQGLVTDGRIGQANGLVFNFGRQANQGFPLSVADLSPSPILFNAYTSESDSIRKTWNMPQFLYSSAGKVTSNGTNLLSMTNCPGKYRRWEPRDFEDITRQTPDGVIEEYVVLEQGTIFRNETNINFPVLRYADVLLMFAEADNEISGGPTALGTQYLNEVRARAGLAKIEDANPVAVANRDEFFKEIIDERLRELAFEGIRKHDLIRWGILRERLELLAETIKGQPFYSEGSTSHRGYLRSTVFYDDNKHRSLPYPLQQVQLNNLMEQKDSWK